MSTSNLLRIAYAVIRPRPSSSWSFVFINLPGIYGVGVVGELGQFAVRSLYRPGDEIETELIPTVKMETGHPVETHLVTSLRRSISLGSYRGLKSQVVEHFGEKIALFEKATPYGEIFIILFQKDSPPHRSTSCL